jgi:hypothetical protein
MTSETLRKDVVARYLATPINVVLVGDDPALDTTNTENDLPKKKVAD